MTLSINADYYCEPTNEHYNRILQILKDLFPITHGAYSVLSEPYTLLSINPSEREAYRLLLAELDARIKEIPEVDHRIYSDTHIVMIAGIEKYCTEEVTSKIDPEDVTASLKAYGNLVNGTFVRSLRDSGL